MHYQTLISLGRKAGLQTREIYQALSARRPEAGDRFMGSTDGNGYVTLYGPNGRVIYRPNASSR
jgi:hypothetical protein